MADDLSKFSMAALLRLVEVGDAARLEAGRREKDFFDRFTDPPLMCLECGRMVLKEEERSKGWTCPCGSGCSAPAKAVATEAGVFEVPPDKYPKFKSAVFTVTPPGPETTTPEPDWVSEDDRSADEKLSDRRDDMLRDIFG